MGAPAAVGAAGCHCFGWPAWWPLRSREQGRQRHAVQAAAPLWGHHRSPRVHAPLAPWAPPPQAADVRSANNGPRRRGRGVGGVQLPAGRQRYACPLPHRPVGLALHGPGAAARAVVSAAPAAAALSGPGRRWRRQGEQQAAVPSQPVLALAPLSTPLSRAAAGFTLWCSPTRLKRGMRRAAAPLRSMSTACRESCCASQSGPKNKRGVAPNKPCTAALAPSAPLLCWYLLSCCCCTFHPDVLSRS